MSVLDLFRLDGQLAIVTGASRGLGATMALALAEAGADVALVARGDLRETTDAIERLGRRAVAIEADLEERGEVDEILQHAQGADILVNNAGIIRRSPFLEFSDDDWDAVIEVNLRSVFALSRGFARALAHRQSGGRIINIASMLSFQGGVRVAGYTAAKSGLLGLTRAMANELRIGRGRVRPWNGTRRRRRVAGAMTNRLLAALLSLLSPRLDRGVRSYTR